MEKEHIKSYGKGNGRKIGIVFILVALLPALIYSVFELSSLSSTEKLIQSIYSKQLDVILFSINQYALDVAQSWSGDINTILITSPSSRVDTATKIFLNRRDAVQGVFYADSTGNSLSFLMRQRKGKEGGDSGIFFPSLQEQSATIEKLLRFASTGYRKIEPVIIGDSASGQELMLLFVTPSRFPARKIAGFIIDAKSFLTEVLRTKIAEAAGEEFILAVFDRRNQQIVLSTAPVEIMELRQKKDLWLFPDYSIGIRLAGTSVEDVVRTRTERNLILIGFLDILLIGAVWLVYRYAEKRNGTCPVKRRFRIECFARAADASCPDPDVHGNALPEAHQD